MTGPRPAGPDYVWGGTGQDGFDCSGLPLREQLLSAPQRPAHARPPRDLRRVGWSVAVGLLVVVALGWAWLLSRPVTPPAPHPRAEQQQLADRYDCRAPAEWNMAALANGALIRSTIEPVVAHVPLADAGRYKDWWIDELCAR